MLAPSVEPQGHPYPPAGARNGGGVQTMQLEEGREMVDIANRLSAKLFGTSWLVLAGSRSAGRQLQRLVRSLARHSRPTRPHSPRARGMETAASANYRNQSASNLLAAAVTNGPPPLSR